MLDFRSPFLELSVLKSLALFVLVLLIPLSRPAQDSAMPRYDDSAEGFRQQLEGLVAAKKGGNEASLRVLLDALAVPNADEWIATRFSTADVPRLQKDYPLFLAGFQKHLAAILENAARLPGWEMVVKPSEIPNPPASSGPESEIPHPTQPIAVENVRYGPAHPEDPPSRSWVNSFVYLEGRFRYVGGTYPFWSEGLQQIRRPQATLYNMRSAQLIHMANPDYPKKAKKAHVEGTVRLHAIIGKDGVPRDLTVLSGDPLLTASALKAVRKWRYQATLLEGHPVEVTTTINVIFALHH
jgi:TonB family protein